LANHEDHEDYEGHEISACKILNNYFVHFDPFVSFVVDLT